MKESEIRRLFMLIQNVYSNFTYDDFKVECWRRILEDIPYETAEANLLRHIRTNSFQPTPAELVGKKEPREGPYIPNVQETRAYLDSLEAQDRLTDGRSFGCPPHLKERLPWNTH